MDVWHDIYKIYETYYNTWKRTDTGGSYDALETKLFNE